MENERPWTRGNLPDLLSRCFDRWCVVEDFVSCETLIYTPKTFSLPSTEFLLNQRSDGQLLTLHQLPWWRCRISKKIWMTKEAAFSWNIQKY